jgi:hypothetical protein
MNVSISALQLLAAGLLLAGPVLAGGPGGDWRFPRESLAKAAALLQQSELASQTGHEAISMLDDVAAGCYWHRLAVELAREACRLFPTEMTCNSHNGSYRQLMIHCGVTQ